MVRMKTCGKLVCPLQGLQLKTSDGTEALGTCMYADVGTA